MGCGDACSFEIADEEGKGCLDALLFAEDVTVEEEEEGEATTRISFFLITLLLFDIKAENGKWVVAATCWSAAM